MIPANMQELVTLMLVADGPPVIPARGNWPLHVALRELHESASREGERDLARLLSLRPSPDVGVRAEGADRALFALVQSGTLVAEGSGRGVVLLVNDAMLVPWRRSIMRLDLGAARLVQRAATRWRTLADTSAKNRSTAARSSTPTVASGAPNRLQVLPGIASAASSRRLEPLSTRLVTR
jgi:hypothetical protein